jgi:triosephosphate isomerase
VKPMLMAGNWKMHKLTGEARKLAADLKVFLPDIDQPMRVLLCPPFTALAEVAEIVEGSVISLGAQNMHWAKRGAFTGELSADMLKDVGCEYVIIGHSERRHIFGETDKDVNKKVKAALDAGLKPIVCVGEKEKEREDGKTEAVVTRQVQKGLDGLALKQMASVVIAYEPVWAIGTGKNATPAQAQKVHAFIRKLISQQFDQSTASSLLILYGGSVTPDNALKLMSQRDISGALVGGASLDAYTFERIVRAGVEAS